jgi:hypothetical protein
MIAMRMMQPSADEVINVVTMRNGLMTAFGAMSMREFMPLSSVLRRALIGICLGYFDNVFLGTAAKNASQMTMIEIIDMVPMPNSGMATARAVDVRTCVGRLLGAGRWAAFPF